MLIITLLRELHILPNYENLPRGFLHITRLFYLMSTEQDSSMFWSTLWSNWEKWKLCRWNIYASLTCLWQCCCYRSPSRPQACCGAAWSCWCPKEQAGRPWGWHSGWPDWTQCSPHFLRVHAASLCSDWAISAAALPPGPWLCAPLCLWWLQAQGTCPKEVTRSSVCLFDRMLLDKWTLIERCSYVWWCATREWRSTYRIEHLLFEWDGKYQCFKNDDDNKQTQNWIHFLPGCSGLCLKPDGLNYGSNVFWAYHKSPNNRHPEKMSIQPQQGLKKQKLNFKNLTSDFLFPLMRIHTQPV